MSNLVCGFIGLGLIGGSIVKALKESNPGIYIVAYDVNPEPLKIAYAEKYIDKIADDIDSSFSDCDYIFLCAPVQKNDSNLIKVKNIISSSCLITDVGSVKKNIHETIHESGLDSQFIGGHPMAGSERTGYINSKAQLLENAYYILTPTSTVPPQKVDEYRNLVQSMGAIPLVIDYNRHDYITAAISHLPHVVAATLVNLIKTSDSEDGLMKLVAAGGFKDITRIASSSPVMWQQICLTNGQNISDLLQSYIDSLIAFKSDIDQKLEDNLYNNFENARVYRDSFINASSGPIKRSFSIMVDIADKEGALAHTINLLAENHINIKNIGITHNRESEDGVLRIELYDEDSMNKAVTILQNYQYSITIRF